MNKHKPFLAAAAIISIACMIAGSFTGCSGESEPSEASATTDSAQQKASAASTQATTEQRHPQEAIHIEPTTIMENSHIIGVDVMLQDELESGCEIYSAVTLLNYYEFSVDEFDFVEKYLNIEPVTTDDDGVSYGPDMNCAFAGQVELGYGAYAPAMQKAIDLYLTQQNSSRKAEIEKNATLKELCEKYIDNDDPVMVWVTTDMELPEEYVEWIVDYTDENASFKEGETFRWPTNEHCMLLIGYDDVNYYFADSLDATVVGYDRENCEQTFKAMGSQAVYLK